LRNSFGDLVANEIPRLRRYAHALTHDREGADDLVQNCLLRALTKSHLWRPGTDLRAWLFTILHNEHVNHVRRSIREGSRTIFKDRSIETSTPPAESPGLRLREFERALLRLPEEQRQAVLLIAVEGFRYEEAAAVLNVPIGTMRSRLSRGRDMLRHLLGMEPRPLQPQTPAPRKDREAPVQSLAQPDEEPEPQRVSYYGPDAERLLRPQGRLARRAGAIA
jgi:RNA polymerase sigma-70 factor, ECF subfamily